MNEINNREKKNTWYSKHSEGKNNKIKGTSTYLSIINLNINDLNFRPIFLMKTGAKTSNKILVK
jgi:hypothetical protein